MIRTGCRRESDTVRRRGQVGDRREEEGHVDISAASNPLERTEQNTRTSSRHELADQLANKTVILMDTSAPDGPADTIHQSNKQPEVDLQSTNTFLDNTTRILGRSWSRFSERTQLCYRDGVRGKVRMDRDDSAADAQLAI